ncbi:aminoacetone oxidase family FAD-binding enzyme [Stieleria sp. ICT_E10.1]|uniref:NAD(P)/FAD-dependent oxidoreductase n=1 Tax=Stieleria sedimenti TaxID=2976331 RepID=UPI00217FD450|nr:aminoacetone oxidase family FAD-binding enzyme [Stieleria sedimenti]MCS7468460.1 aminoacetone oxidase family FAD-binding enzyme [Stieleria sedimenti]
MTDSSTLDKSAHRVVVIGAGAAGLVAAAEAAVRGARVLLLEKNGKTGVKILMSGGTRCNITQDTDAKGIVQAFGKTGRFLQKSVGAFGPADVVAMFHEQGVQTKVESTGKVFPQSDRAIHVRDALQRRAVQAGVKLHLRCAVTAVEKTADEWLVRTESESIRCDRLIVTAGGKSWPGCGTTGDAYAWLHKLGHTIVRTRPALVPLVGGYDWTHSLSGLTLDDCIASVYQRSDWQSKAPSKRKPLVSRRSSWLFTHLGFSGPAAMDVSGTITRADSFDDVTLAVDLVPELSVPQIEAALTDRGGGGRRTTTAVIAEWLPSRLAESVARASDAECPIAELSRVKLQALVNGLKDATFPVQGTRGFAKAEVTAGGVKLTEVDPRTMESRKVPGLYIAGEVLDVDGWIGGYNFQAAFSTGRAAGIAAAE